MDVLHGTYGGYQAHRKRGETPCARCREANAQYKRDIRTGDVGMRRKDRWWNNTRAAALALLAKEYPERFEEILAQVRAQPRGDRP